MPDLITTADINAMLDSMADNVRKQFNHQKPLLIGIHTGGVWVAEQLIHRLGSNFFDAPLGILNIAYYRDDFTRIGIHPQVMPSDIPFHLDDRHLLLIDDIFHSGRTIRAALNEIFDYGRPARVTLAVLLERNGHELPLKADIIGQSITLNNNQHIKLVKGNDNALTLNIETRKEAV